MHVMGTAKDVTHDMVVSQYTGGCQVGRIYHESHCIRRQTAD